MKIVYISTAKTGPNPAVDQIIELGLVYDDTGKKFVGDINYKSLLRPEVISSTSPLALWRNTNVLKHLEDGLVPNASEVVHELSMWFRNLPEKNLTWGGDNVWLKELPFLARLMGKQTHEMDKVCDCEFTGVIDPIQICLDKQGPASLDVAALRNGISTVKEESSLQRACTMALVTRKALEIV